MSSQETTKTLLKGTAILAAAALVSKMLGVVYRIPYQNITGNIGLYVYQQVYPLYSILLILATAGFPLAISKLVAERLAVGDEAGAKRIFHISIYTLLGTGIFFFLSLYLSAPWIALWMEDEQLTLPIRSVSFALLIVPVMAAIRGYFQGHQNMVPTAISQVVEQIIRVVTILALSYWFIYNQYDAYYAGAGAVFGAFTGALSALIVLILFWRRLKRSRLEIMASEVSEPTGEVNERSFSQEKALVVIKKILYYSLPICLGAMVLPLLQLVDALTVTKSLVFSGWELEDAKNWKGVYDRGQPLVQFAAFFATALSLALVPSISEAHANGLKERIALQAELAMRLTMFIGLAASFGLATLASPINIMLYKTNEGSLVLSVLAFTTIFSTMGIASGAILQGLGQVMLPARNLFFGVIVKLLLNILLIPLWDITGAAIATVLAYAVATFLNLKDLYRLTSMQLSFQTFLAKPLLAVLLMTVCVWLSKEGLAHALEGVVVHERLYYTLIALTSVLVGIVSYAVALLRSGSVTEGDLAPIPKINRLLPVLNRLHLLRKNK